MECSSNTGGGLRKNGGPADTVYVYEGGLESRLNRHI